MECKKCEENTAEFVSQNSVYDEDTGLCIGTEQHYKCAVCNLEQTHFLFPQGERYDFVSLSQPDG